MVHHLYSLLVPSNHACIPFTLGLVLLVLGMLTSA